MTIHRDALDNDDCALVAQLWGLLSNPDSGAWYLGNIIRNGLKDPALGIDLAPFPRISLGDIPEQTMFDWPVIGSMAISMSATELRGLDTYTGGTLVCTAVSASETDVQLTLQFSAVTFTGSYDVSASGIAGCAVATAATLLGNPPSSALLAGESGDSRLALAAWYRDSPKALPASDNGQVAVGTYYLHEDTIEKVTTSELSAAKLYRQTLSKQKPTADAATAATAYWRQQQEGEPPPGPPPKVGDGSQYSGGFQSYVYLNMAVDQARQVAALPLEPGNEYADLQNAMLHFNAQVIDYQKSHPGESDAGEIMQYVADADPVPPDAFDALGLAGIPVHDHDSGAVVEYVTPWPIDRERSRLAYNARAPKAADAPALSFDVGGTFEDTAQNLTAGLTVRFVSQDGEKLLAKALATKLEIGNLRIQLGNESGFDSQPGLYDRVATWIANTQSFQDTLKSKVSAGLNSDGTLDCVSGALNAGLKKLGLQ